MRKEYDENNKKEIKTPVELTEDETNNSDEPKTYSILGEWRTTIPEVPVNAMFAGKITTNVGTTMEEIVLEFKEDGTYATYDMDNIWDDEYGGYSGDGGKGGNGHDYHYIKTGAAFLYSYRPGDGGNGGNGGIGGKGGQSVTREYSFNNNILIQRGNDGTNGKGGNGGEAGKGGKGGTGDAGANVKDVVSDAADGIAGNHG